MGSRRIVFKKDFWYDDNGCSCCGATRMDFFASEDLGITSSSEEEIYVRLLEIYDPTWDSSQEDLFLNSDSKSVTRLIPRLESLGIIVEFYDEIDDTRYPPYFPPLEEHYDD